MSDNPTPAAIARPLIAGYYDDPNSTKTFGKPQLAFVEQRDMETYADAMEAELLSARQMLDGCLRLEAEISIATARAERAEALVEGMAEALKGLLEHYLFLVKCGDCGYWDAGKEPEVIAARAALESSREEVVG